jgi:hypothetical protein
MDGLADQVAELAIEAFVALGADVTEIDRLTTAPLAHGLVGAVFAAVSQWVRQGAKVPSEDNLVTLICEAVVAILTTRLAAYGITIDPDAPLAEIVAP